MDYNWHSWREIQQEGYVLNFVYHTCQTQFLCNPVYLKNLISHGLLVSWLNIKLVLRDVAKEKTSS